MEQFIERAILEARKSGMSSKHGCICINPKTMEIISTGYNTYESSDFRFDTKTLRNQSKNKIYSLHAETRAIFRVSPSFRRNLIIVVVRVNSQGQLLNSRPCSQCERIINKYNIRVYYSA